MSQQPLDCRAAAARCIASVTTGLSLSQQLLIFEQRVAEKDRALFRQLCYGVLRFYPKLAGIVWQLLKKPLKDKDQDIFVLLLLGIYQLSDTRIPDHAAVNSTVAATKTLKKDWAKQLVNGVLRQWQRREAELLGNLTESAAQSHPKWLHKALTRAWPEHVTAIEEANNQHPPMCLRVNQLQSNTEDYLHELTSHNISAERCDFAPHGIRLQQAVNVDQLPYFFEGRVSVQDEAPQLSAQLLDLKPQQRVLDACCAPGGKTCHLLETEANLKEVVAIDVDEKRLERVIENLNRLKLDASLVISDACQTEQWWDGEHFDRILLDAPCSATGVIRRNPDIKLHRSSNDIKQLATLQLQMLDALWPTLKPGGLLLYATCSILPEENENLVAIFCGQQTDAKHRVIDAPWGLARNFGRQLFPQNNGHDGFYFALIEKSRQIHHKKF